MTGQNMISADYLLPLLVVENSRYNNVLKFVLFEAMRGRLEKPRGDFKKFSKFSKKNAKYIFSKKKFSLQFEHAFTFIFGQRR